MGAKCSRLRSKNPRVAATGTAVAGGYTGSPPTSTLTPIDDEWLGGYAGRSGHLPSPEEDFGAPESRSYYGVMSLLAEVVEAETGNTGEGLFPVMGPDNIYKPFTDDSKIAKSGAVDRISLIAPLPPSPSVMQANVGTLNGSQPLPPIPDDNQFLEMYCYDALPTPTSIRVLELLSFPKSTTPKAIPQCKLHTVDLANSPTYDALSYTWGIPKLVYRESEEDVDANEAKERCFPIICDGKTILVTKNLYDALEQLSQSEFDSNIQGQVFNPSTGYIWIDAISIDQENIPERNSQVEMMAQIYEGAQLVVIWLGPKSWCTAPAIATMEMVTYLALEDPQEDFSKVNIYDRMWWERRGLEHSGDFTGVYVFFRQAWFTRAWIFQEAVFARKAVMLSGSDAYPWGRFLHFCMFLVKHGWHMQLEKTARLVAYGLPLPNFFQRHKKYGYRNSNLMSPEMRQNWFKFPLGFEPGKELPIASTFGLGQYRQLVMQNKGKMAPEHHGTILKEILEGSRSLESGDPRDKIYAVLAVSERTIDRDGAEWPIRPDYSKSVRDVYTEVMRHVLSSAYSLETAQQQPSRSTEILWQVEDKSATKHQCLPSWVPDFSVECYPAPFEPNMAGDWRVWPLKYRPKDPLRVEGDKIRSLGVLVDEVEEVAAEEGDHLRNAVKVVLGLPRIYRSGASLDIASDEAGDRRMKFQEVMTMMLSIDTARRHGAAASRNAQSVQTPIQDTDRAANSGMAEIIEVVDKKVLIQDRMVSLHAGRQVRKQSRVEALWRTLLLDFYGGRDPAPLEGGLAFGDWIVSRVRNAYTDYLLHQHRGDEHPAVKGVEAEVKLWADLDSGESQEADTDVQRQPVLVWPGTTPDRTRLESQLTAFNTQLQSLQMLEALSAGESSLLHARLTDQVSTETFDQLLGSDPIRFLPSLRQLCLSLTGDPDIARVVDNCRDRDTRQAKFFIQYNKYNRGRRVFRTKRGWLGNGHLSTRPGDQVWLLPHCDAPFVLRRKVGADGGRDTTGIFSMVGACYVHGMMHREDHMDEWLGIREEITLE
ncbi:uncharacterized protein MKZ38_004289 [Zalerion maritima]|uniref:Heterokaryon incompatibility domain-containing protein n=1 Tax=Zalerion maritima TaxID=339359 RepID=A0AAD5RMT6_9PEZI|nr:uncharacterized protein MKZ38_004289 [Zalerion maritima]